MMDAIENFEGTVSVAGRSVYNVRFADDIDWIAGISKEPTDITERLDNSAEIRNGDK